MIWNISTNKIICRNHKECRNVFSQTLGLMFSKPRSAVFRISAPKKMLIHTFFMRFPLDLIYVKNNKVVELKENVRPWKLYNPKSKADILIECPAGAIKDSKTKRRHEIKIKT